MAPNSRPGLPTKAPIGNAPSVPAPDDYSGVKLRAMAGDAKAGTVAA